MAKLKAWESSLQHRVLTLLAEERMLHGHGSAALIDHKIGKSEGYFGRLMRGEIGLQMTTLEQLLEVLEVDVTDFFARSVGFRLVPLRVLRRLERSCHDFGSSRRLPTLVPLFERIDRLIGRLPLTLGSDGWGADPADEPTFSRLDEQIISDPTAALPRAHQLLGKQLAAAEAEDSGRADGRVALAWTLGLVASAERAQLRYRTAAGALRRALELVTGNAVGEAEILQRSVALVIGHGDLEVARLLLARVIELHLLTHRSSGMGQVLVLRAILAGQRGSWREAGDLYRAANSYLAKGAWSWRFACELGLARVAKELGEPDVAEGQVGRAAAEHRSRRGPSWWRLQYLKGELALARGDLELAASTLGRARDGFATQPYPLDTAIAGLDLAKVLWKARRLDELWALAAEVVGWLPGFGKHGRVTEALHRIVRASLTQELDLTLLERASLELRRVHPEASFLLQGWMP